MKAMALRFPVSEFHIAYIPWIDAQSGGIAETNSIGDGGPGGGAPRILSEPTMGQIRKIKWRARKSMPRYTTEITMAENPQTNGEAVKFERRNMQYRYNHLG